MIHIQVEPSIQEWCPTIVHLDQFAAVLLAYLVLAPVPSICAEPGRLDSIVTRLAKIDSFAFGGVGFVLATSQGELDYRDIMSRKSAQADFETVFRIGNSQAKCYALTGLRQLNPSRFESLAASVPLSGTCVEVTRGCITFSESIFDVLRQIQFGVFSGPLTHELVPLPDTEKRPTTNQKQTLWQRLLTLLFAPSSKPEPPAPPPGPPPPPLQPGSLRSVATCILEKATDSH